MRRNNTSKECILCGLCLEVCPVFQITQREELSPRGKGFLFMHFHEFDIKDKKTIELAELCVGCRRCLGVCPQKIDLPLEIARLKSVHPDWKAWIWARIIKSGTGLLPSMKGVRAVIPGKIPVIKKSLLARPPVPSLIKARQKNQNKDRQAVIFPGCVGKHLQPELEIKAVQLLNFLGYETLKTPDWQCCGYPLGSAGLFALERKEMANNLELWQAMNRPLVFVFCATCLDGLRNPFGGFDDLTQWESFRQDLQPLIEQLPELEFEPESSLEKSILVWHEPCHGTGNSGIILQNVLNGLSHDLAILKPKCCGMGGSFALQNPELSSKIAADFWKDVSECGNALLLTDCSGCVLQLDAAKPDQTIVSHWLEVINI